MADERADALRHDRDRFIGFAFASADLLLETGGDLRITWAGGATRTLLRLDSDKAAQAVARLSARGHLVCLDDFRAGASETRSLDDQSAACERQPVSIVGKTSRLGTRRAVQKMESEV